MRIGRLNRRRKLYLRMAAAALVVGLARDFSAATEPDWLRVLESQGEFGLAWERAAARLGEAPSGSTGAASASTAPTSAGVPDAELVRTALRLLVRLGQTDRALEFSERHAHALDPEERHLLCAVLELRRDDAAAALAHLRAAPIQAGLLGFAAYLEAEAQHDLEHWQETLQAVAVAETRSLPNEMRQRLRVLEGSAALALGDLVRLRGLARGLGADARSDDRNGLLLIALCRALLATGEGAQATDWLLELLEARPTPAESAYVILQRRQQGSVWQPSPREQLALARYELGAGRAAAARARMLALLDEPALLREDAASACVVLAESYQSEGRDTQCLHALRQYASRIRRTEAEPEVLRLKARSLRKLGQEDAAIAVYKDLAQRFPAHPRADDALYEVAWRYEIRADFARAEKAYAGLVARFPRSTLADDAALREGLCALRGGHRDTALARFGALVARYPDSPLVPRALYWSLWIHAASGDTSRTAPLASRLQKEYPTSYFTFLAAQSTRPSDSPRLDSASAEMAQTEDMEEIEAIEGMEEDGLELAQRSYRTYQAAIDTLRQRANLEIPAGFREASQLWRFCIDHGLRNEALWETQRLELRFTSQPGALLELVAGNYARGAHERLVRLTFLLGQQLRQPELAEPLLVLRHPAPLSAMLSESARRNGVSHAAVLAIMRQESAFNSRVDSHAGARGLMQVMPRVGQRLARENGLGELHPDALYDPRLNVTLGCQLLAQELERADGRVTQALAAYNAGSEPAAAWSRRLRPEEPAELYLDVAEYLETRQYLESVLGGLEIYRRLYALH